MLHRAALDDFTVLQLTPGADGLAQQWWPNPKEMEYTPKPEHVVEEDEQLGAAEPGGAG
jgi:hypothetical protein